jgi:hypothetical protein
MHAFVIKLVVLLVHIMLRDLLRLKIAFYKKIVKLSSSNNN